MLEPLADTARDDAVARVGAVDAIEPLTQPVEPEATWRHARQCWRAQMHSGERTPDGPRRLRRHEAKTQDLAVHPGMNGERLAAVLADIAALPHRARRRGRDTGCSQLPDDGEL